MGGEARVLLVDDDRERALRLAEAAMDVCSVDVVRSPGAARGALAVGGYRAVVARLDPTASTSGGVVLLARTAAAGDPPTPVVLLTPGDGVPSDLPSGTTTLPLPIACAAFRDALAEVLATGGAERGEAG